MIVYEEDIPFGFQMIYIREIDLLCTNPDKVNSKDVMEMIKDLTPKEQYSGSFTRQGGTGKEKYDETN